MEHIQDTYKKKPEMIEKLFDHLTKVNLKVDGKPFQVVYNEETEELEYHGRSGNETKVGPLIDDMYRLFSKPINDAIRHIETRTEVFKKYKFLTFEVISEILLLTAIITKDGKFIDDPDEIDKIAEELETDVMPCLWKGKINEEQRETLMQAISTDIVPTKDEFVKWVKALFGTYDKFPKSLISRSEEFIEGIVFFFNVDGKVVEYKLVDPTFRQSVKDNQSNMKADNEENGEKYKQIYEIFVDWAKDNASKLDDGRMRSIEFNFIEMMKDVKRYNKLMNLAAGLTTITTDAYFLQPDRISDELKKAIKKHGKVYQLLYEKFVRLFWKAKKRNYTISKEFQQEVNKVCGMIGESLGFDDEEVFIINEEKKYSEENISDIDIEQFKNFVKTTNDISALKPYIIKWIKSTSVLSSDINYKDLGINKDIVKSLISDISSAGHKIIVNMLNINNLYKFFNTKNDGIFETFNDSPIINVNLCKRINELSSLSEEDIDKIFNSKLDGVGKGELLFKLLCSDITSSGKGDLALKHENGHIEIECKCGGCLSNQKNKEPIKSTLKNAFKECSSLLKIETNDFDTLDFSTKDNETNEKTSLNFYWRKLLKHTTNEDDIEKCIGIFDKHLKNGYVNVQDKNYLSEFIKDNNLDIIKNNFSNYLGYAAICYYADQEQFKYLLVMSTSKSKHSAYASLIDIDKFKTTNPKKLVKLLDKITFNFSSTGTQNGGGITINRLLK